MELTASQSSEQQATLQIQLPYLKCSQTTGSWLPNIGIYRAFEKVVDQEVTLQRHTVQPLMTCFVADSPETSGQL